MPDLEELLASLDEGDAAAIRDKLEEAEQAKQQLAIKDRDLKLAKGELRKRFPRAWKAYELGELDLGKVIEDSEIEKLMKGKEEVLARLGVPLVDEPGEPVTQPVAQSEPSPTEAFGTPVAPSGPPPSRNLVQDFLEAMKGETDTDRANMVTALAEMNQRGAKDEIRQLADMISGPPIIPRDVLY